MTCGGRERDREKEEGRVEGGEGEREGEREGGGERGEKGKREGGKEKGRYKRDDVITVHTHTQCQSSHLPHLVQPVDVQVVSLYWFGNPGYDLLCQVFQELFSHASYGSYSLLTEVGDLSRGEAHYTTDCDFRLASRFLSKVHVYQITGCQGNSLHLQRISHSTHTIGTEESVLVREVS